jgi:two-component system cell cycle sensor histidine kinase/response regulator CckA
VDNCSRLVLDLRREESTTSNEPTQDGLEREPPGFANGQQADSVTSDSSIHASDTANELERLRENERLLNGIIDQNPHALWLSDRDGTLVRINRACCELLHIREAEVVGKYNCRRDNILEKQGLLPLVERVFQEGKTITFALDYDTARLSQLALEHSVHVVLEVTMSPVVNQHGELTNAIVMHRDVTAQKNLEQQLVQSQKMEAIGRLAGGIAHDFNNMLSVILGHAELMWDELPKNPTLIEGLREIEKAATHARDITAQLLGFSRRQMVAPKTLDLNAEIGDISGAIARLIGEDIHLNIVCSPGLWPILLDPAQLKQILLNLAVNARDAMSNGGRLSIETANVVLDEGYCTSHAECSPGHYVQLSISDDGEGMDTQTLSRIFEPFFTTKATGKGTGLGLATVYGIVKQNSGQINVYSEPRTGTVFKIYLPRSESSVTQDRAPNTSPLTLCTGRILLVEDDDKVRKLAAAMLARLGYEIEVTASPAEALARSAEITKPIDLLLTDVVMPGMNGSELHQKLLATRPGLKVLFMSGYTENVIVHHGVLRDATSFIQKPFSLVDLADKIQTVL